MQTEELQNEITEINERAAQLKQQLEDSKEKFSQTMVTLFASEETTGYLEKIQKHVNFTIDFRKDQVDMFVSAIIEELKNPATKTSSNHVGLRDSLPTMGSSLIFAIWEKIRNEMTSNKWETPPTKEELTRILWALGEYMVTEYDLIKDVSKQEKQTV